MELVTITPLEASTLIMKTFLLLSKRMLMKRVYHFDMSRYSNNKDLHDANLRL